jgi:hypothetical protein
LAILAAIVCTAAAGLYEHGRQTLELSRLVVLTDAGAPGLESAAERYEVLSISGSGAIAASSARLTRGFLLGSLGAPFSLVVLLGCALVAATVAWPVRGSRAGAALALVAALAVGTLMALWSVRAGLEVRALRQTPATPTSTTPPV